jgi:hypothetical protein
LKVVDMKLKCRKDRILYYTESIKMAITPPRRKRESVLFKIHCHIPYRTKSIVEQRPKAGFGLEGFRFFGPCGKYKL